MKALMTHSLGPAIAVLTVAMVALAAASAGQPEAKPTRKDFMRQKLVIAKDILEGLALEQFASIAKNAKILKRLSAAAEWEYPSIPKDSDYALFTREFQRNTDELLKQAGERNIDGATLAYIKVTMNCVECHRFIRHVGK